MKVRSAGDRCLGYARRRGLLVRPGETRHPNRQPRQPQREASPISSTACGATARPPFPGAGADRADRRVGSQVLGPGALASPNASPDDHIHGGAAWQVIIRRISTGVLAFTLLGAGCGNEPAAPADNDLEMIYWLGDAQAGACYRELPDPVAVRILDRSEAPVPGETVEFRVVHGDGSVREGTATSDSAGFAVDYWTVGPPGPQVLEARATSARLAGEFARFTAMAESTEVGERRITTGTALVGDPAIAEGRIVWSDWRNGNSDIYLYDLAAGTERRITTDPSRQEFPAISGDRIVWHDLRNGGADIYLYDLVTQMERRITWTTTAVLPDISGDRIVWQDSRNGSPDIYLYDLATETERQITGDVRWQQFPAISGDRIVWQDLRNGRRDIYLYDLTTQSEQRLTTDVSNLPQGTSPAISGARVVWVDDRNGRLDVYLYDVTTGIERRITTDAAVMWWFWSSARISGDHIVWYDVRGGGLKLDIYLYDLATETERRIGGDPHTFWGEPAISGDRVVWGEERNRNRDIYLYDLANACIPPAR